MGLSCTKYRSQGLTAQHINELLSVDHDIGITKIKECLKREEVIHGECGERIFGIYVTVADTLQK